jgi:hypothetical protein
MLIFVGESMANDGEVGRYNVHGVTMAQPHKVV